MTEVLDVPRRHADSGEPMPPFALGGVGTVAALGALALLIAAGRRLAGRLCRSE